MVRKIVVVFDGLKAGRFAKEAQMVDRDEFWQQSLKR